MGSFVARAPFVLAGVALPWLALVACGSESAHPPVLGQGASAGSSREAGVPSNVFGGTLGDASAAAPSDDGGACVTSTVAATLTPVDLVMMFDQSGSMGNQNYGFTCPTVVSTCLSYDIDQQVVIICGDDSYGGWVQVADDGTISQGGQPCPLGMAQGAPAYLCVDPVSMQCTPFYYDPAKKWIPATTALEAFLGDARSKGVSCSLQFFPQLQTNGQAVCSSTSYETPAVELTALPNADAFASIIGLHSPNGGTPTDVALTGAYAHARSLKSSRPDDVVAVVLVTDGYPNQCADGRTPNLPDVIAVASAASQDATAPVNTYVIGIGDGLANLNQIASAGGTSAATIVSTTNPTQTASDFENALATIRRNTLPCDVALPAPPDGRTLDVNAVNVDVIDGAQRTRLSYNRDCTGGAGWHYDDATHPTRVELCASTCSDLRQVSGEHFEIAFGCATVGGVLR